ncbi:MAG: response regulator [Gemmatimonadales bacterium]
MMDTLSRVLVVDDDTPLRHAIVKTLTRAGYLTVEAASGQEAIECYRVAPADLVLTDIYMPGTDGVEAIIRLRAEFPDLRVVAMSGGGHMAKEGVLDLATRLGARGTLEKPVGTEALLEMIRTALLAEA